MVISERAGTENAVKHSRSYGFSGSHVQTWELDDKEGWALKNWHFQIVVLEKTLESPLDCKEMKPVNRIGKQARVFIKVLMLNLKLQYFVHLLQRADSLEKTPMMGKIEDKRRKEWQRMRWLNNISNSMDMNLSKLWEVAEDRGAWKTAIHGVTKSWTWLSDWITTSLGLNIGVRFLWAGGQLPQAAPGLSVCLLTWDDF